MLVGWPNISYVQDKTAHKNVRLELIRRENQESNYLTATRSGAPVEVTLGP